MKVLVATEKPFAAEAVAGIRQVFEQAGYETVMLEKYTSTDNLKAALAGIDALIVRSDKVTADVLDAAKSLKIVVRAGAGYDNIDLEAAKARGVVVENTPGQNSNAVAELVFGMLIMAERNMFDGSTGRELKGKSIGIQAFGQVGRNVARIAKGFDMEVSALDPFCPDSVMKSAGVKPVHSARDLYANNRVVSIHIPATPETKGSIGRELITSMPVNGVLVNTARKEVIDEAGLRAALSDRPDIKYLADVKPDNAAQLEAEFPGRVFFTPKKMGAQTAEANINAGIAAARQIVAFFVDGDTRFQVNK